MLCAVCFWAFAGQTYHIVGNFMSRLNHVNFDIDKQELSGIHASDLWEIA